MPHSYYRAYQEGSKLICTGEKGKVLVEFQCPSEEEVAARLRVLKEADEWIGTPYHHEGRLKGIGTDCAMVLAEVFERAKVMPHMDFEHYPPDWHLHQGNEIYLKHVKANCGVVPAGIPGDIAMWKFGRCYAHGSIIAEPGFPHIIHALKEYEMVARARGDQGQLFYKAPIFYSPWAKPAG